MDAYGRFPKHGEKRTTLTYLRQLFVILTLFDQILVSSSTLKAYRQILQLCISVASLRHQRASMRSCSMLMT